VDNRALVDGVIRNDQESIAELYLTVKSFSSRLWCLGDSESEDATHDSFLLLLRAIQRGYIKEPDCLMGYVGVVVNRRKYANIKSRQRKRARFTEVEPHTLAIPHNANPEKELAAKERAQIAGRAMELIRPLYRTVLERFYLNGEDAETIGADFGWDYPRFNCIKSRAKAEFGKAGRRLLLARQPR
jgi:DNA-directed RNA polymerase specialized sigma24 family protein